jgi:hypothetical protein
MSNFVERVFSNHTLFSVAQFRKKAGKELKYFYKSHEGGIDGTLIAVVMIAIVVGVTAAIVVLIKQDISRNIAREATQYSYKVGQTAQCDTDTIFLVPSASTTWRKCTIVGVTSDHRYYTATYSYFDSSSQKTITGTTKFSIQNIGIQ